MEREIIHVDIASFAVTLERLVHPELRRSAVIVAATGAGRSVVTAVSPEAWQSGVRRGMAVGTAVRYCPGVAVVPPNEALYGRASRAVCRILSSYSPVLEPSGYGHAYVDISGTGRLFGPPRDVAWRAQREIRSQLRLDATVGVAANKMVSRIASVVIKPVGLQDVRAGDEPGFLAPLPAPLLPGVGPPVRDQFDELNIRWIRDIARMQLQHLTLAFGRFGLLLHQRSTGIDNTPVRPPSRIPSIDRERTLEEDSNDWEVLRTTLFEMCREACRQLRADACRARGIELRVVYSDYREAIGREMLPALLQSESILRPKAERLLRRVVSRRLRVRRMQVRLTDVVRGCVQLELFPDREPERRARLDAAIDVLSHRNLVTN
jgi:DNA polymerase-4